MSGALELSVVVPVHNEEPGVEVSIHDLQDVLNGCAFRYEIIVVDDASTDGTAAILDRFPGIRSIRNDRRCGYGASIKRGIRAASFAWILTTDGDGTYAAANVPRLVAAMGDADMIVGARALSQIHNPASWNLGKRLSQMVLSRLVGTAIPDLNSGMRLVRRELALLLEDILSDGFSYSTGLTISVLRGGGAVRFTPIEYGRRLGRSKVQWARYTTAFLRSVAKALLSARRDARDEQSR